MKRFISLFVLLYLLFVTPCPAQKGGQKYQMYPQISLVEMRILDTISNLYEVKVQRSLVLKSSKGSRYLKPMIVKRPTANFKYYWVKVVEDNGGALVTHFNFYVNEKTLEVTYFDPSANKEISLSQWRKEKK